MDSIARDDETESRARAPAIVKAGPAPQQNVWLFPKLFQERGDDDPSLTGQQVRLRRLHTSWQRVAQNTHARSSVGTLLVLPKPSKDDRG